MGAQPSTRILVPVAESPTLRNTVGYAVQEAVKATEEGGRAMLRFVHAPRWKSTDLADDTQIERAEELLDRVVAWTEEDLPEDAVERVDVATDIVGDDEYLFSPRDFAQAFGTYAELHDIRRIIVDPEYRPGGSAPMLYPLEGELDRMGFEVEEAPVERPTRRGTFVNRAGLGQYVLIFGASFLFYQLLGGFAGLLDYATGAFSAAVVTLVLGRVSLKSSPNFGRLVGECLRFLAYAPYLLWEIVKANFSVAYIVLHPRLPIDPEMVRYEAAVWTDLPATTLANSITLTPGTLTVDISERDFLVHTLVDSAKEGLYEGGLERGVRFVFYGRPGARIPTPRERESIEEDVRREPEEEADEANMGGESA